MPRFLEEVKTALCQYCVPVPSPEEHVITITPEDAKRLLADGCPAPSSTVNLVALNVQPDPRAPLGVRTLDKSSTPAGGPSNDAYRFPVRIDDHTRFMDPTELPMWMNSQERRVAIFLVRALAGREQVRVNVHCRKGPNHEAVYERELALLTVDEQQQIARFREWGVVAGGEIAIPFSFISSVWPGREADRWEVAVNGSLIDTRGPQPEFRFRPYLAGA